jgi:hypothetical protein
MRYSFLLSMLLLCNVSTIHSFMLTGDKIIVGDKAISFEEMVHLPDRIYALSHRIEFLEKINTIASLENRVTSLESQVALLEYALIATALGFGVMVYDRYFYKETKNDESEQKQEAIH